MKQVNLVLRQVAAAVCCLLAAAHAYAEKTDVVEFGSSRMVGEVKRLDRGKLYFKTEATDTIEIDWAEVKSLVTDQHLRTERRDGSYVTAQYMSGAEANHLLIKRDGHIQATPMSEVVAFEPIESTFWEILDIDTSVGYSYTKATSVEEFDLSAEFSYDTEDRSRSLTLSQQSSVSSDDDRSVRNKANLTDLRLGNNRKIWGWLGEYQTNDALDLDYRVIGAIVAGGDFYPLPNQRFRGFTGLAVSSEASSGQSSRESTELVLGGVFDWYRFSSPEVDLSSSLLIFPSITDSGRVRSHLEISLRWEIFDDLFWQLQIYDDFDSEPRIDDDSENTTRNDYGISTSLGWSW